MVPADVSRRLAVALDIGQPTHEMRNKVADAAMRSDSWENLPEAVKRFVRDTERM